MKIDSHHHLWKYSADEYPWMGEGMEVLRKDYWTDDLRAIAADNQVDGFITVQARQSILETQTLLDLTQQEPLIRGVVGWVDFASEQCEEQLEQFGSHPRLKGLRHVVHDEPDDQFILGTAFNRGIKMMAGRGLVYDILIFAKHLTPSIRFAEMHSNIPMVVDHIAKPTIRSTKIDQQWQTEIRQLASLSHVACKFSGVATEVRDDSWNIETIRPYWETVLECFGPKRLMFGSDWPVCLLRTEYTRWMETVIELVSTLSSDEQADIMGRTAQRIYHLE